MAVHLGNESAVRRQSWVDRARDSDGDVAATAEHADAHAGMAASSPGALLRLLAPSPRDPNAQRARSEPQGAARDLPVLHKPGREPVWHGRGPRSVAADPVVSRWPTAAAPAHLRSTIPERAPQATRLSLREPMRASVPEAARIAIAAARAQTLVGAGGAIAGAAAAAAAAIAAQPTPVPAKESWFKHFGHALQARTERVHHQAELCHAALTASPALQGGSGWLHNLSQFSHRLHALIASLRTPVPALQVKARDAAALSDVTAAVHQRFAAQASNKESFTALLHQAFGDKFDAGKAETIRQQALAGDFSWAPKVCVVSSQALADLSGTQGPGTAQGAYVKSSDTIYISRELLHADPAQAQRILMEEMGHGLDARLNTSDAVGDEGEIFSKLMHGDAISAPQMAALKADNDHGVVMINGQAVTVEYGFFSKAFKAVTGGIKKVAGAVTRGVVNLAKSAVKVGTGLVTMDFDKVREGFKDGVNAVKTSVKAVHQAVKDTAKEIHRITKQAFQKLMQSKLFAAVLMVCRFIPVVQFAVYVIDVVRAAYMVYQGIKHKSLGAVLGGVAGLVSGAGNVAGAFGASAATVNTISNVATAASRLSMAYSAVANKDMSAAMGLLGSFGGQGSTLSTATNFAQQGLGIRDAVRSHDALAALGGTLGLAGAATGNEQLAYARDAVNGARAVRELDRGNLDAAQSLVSGTTLARAASDEFDAGVQQRLREAEGASNRTLINANAGDAQLRAGPAEQDSAMPAPRIAFDDDGNLMPGVVDTRAPLAQQLPQLTDALVAQGYSAEEASRLAWRRLAPPADPFLVQSDGDERTAAEALADRLGVPRNQIVNAGLLDEAGRSFDVLRGFAEGAGFSLLDTGHALAEVASSPLQFARGVKALLTSAEARGQFSDEFVSRVRSDVQMLEDAFNSGDLRGTGQQLGKLTTDLAQVAGGVDAIARLGVSATSAGGRVILGAMDVMADKALRSVPSLFDAAGKPLMDFRALTTAQKQVIGETMGPEAVQRLVPDATRIGRVPAIGERGIDDLYRVSRPDADYVVVEYKYGSSALGKTADGLQMSDTWLQGTVSGRDRIADSVGKVEARAIDVAIRQNRVEKWLVHTDPFGNVTVGLLDKNGKFILQPSSKVTTP
jgi:hypothetical protein